MSYETLKHGEVVARKRHVCDWCGRHIEKGEKYNYEAFKYEGDFCTWHSHLACSRVASAIWDFVDPDDGMDSWEFDEGCAEVCRTFVCPTCACWIPQLEECEMDESYCIERMDEFFKTHELYTEKDGFYQKWKCREKGTNEAKP